MACCLMHICPLVTLYSLLTDRIPKKPGTITTVDNVMMTKVEVEIHGQQLLIQLAVHVGSSSRYTS